MLSHAEMLQRHKVMEALHAAHQVCVRERERERKRDRERERESRHGAHLGCQQEDGHKSAYAQERLCTTTTTTSNLTHAVVW